MRHRLIRLYALVLAQLSKLSPVSPEAYVCRYPDWIDKNRPCPIILDRANRAFHLPVDYYLTGTPTLFTA